MTLEDFIGALGRHEAAWLSLSHNRIGFVPGNRTLVVSFMALAEDGEPEADDPQAIWGGSFLEARGHSILGVQRQRNDWYRAPDLHQALRQLSQAGFFAGFDKVMFYGGSMGGFAALAFASLAPGCTVLAHNPQSTLRASATPWETRFDFARHLDWDGEFSDGAEGARQAGVVYVSYDPWCEEDRRHVDRLEGSRLVRLVFPHVGHQVPLWLQQLKVLGKVFDEALEGQLSTARFRTLVKGRPQLPRYTLELVQRRIAPRRAACVLERARATHPFDTSLQQALWDFTRQQHVPPTRPTPRIALWVHDLADARALARHLSANAPGLHLALDPLHDPARPTPLAELLRRPAHPPMVADEVKRLLYGEPLLIHVVQPKGPRHRQSLDALLLQTLADLDYRHLLLYRRHPSGRAEAIAEQWQALSLMGEMMRARGLRPEVLALDGHGPQGQPPAQPADWQTLLGLSAPRAAAPSVPRPDLQHWPTPREGQAAYRLEVERATPVMGALMLDPLDAAYASGNRLTLTGLAVPPVEFPANTQLVLLHGEQRLQVPWGRASPGGPHHFPGHPLAPKARFGPVDAPVDPQQAALLCWQAPGQAPQVMATLQWCALTERQPMSGVLWSDQRLGFLPMPGTGSVAVVQAIERALDTPTDQVPLPGRLPWGVDISGAMQRFAVVAEPVRRFRALCARWAAEDPRLARLNAHEQVQSVIQRLEREPDLVTAAWAERFWPQARWIAQAQPLEVLSWHDLARAQDWLSQHLGVTVSLAPASSKSPWWSRWRSNRDALPESVQRWIRKHYAQDEALYRGP